MRNLVFLMLLLSALACTPTIGPLSATPTTISPSPVSSPTLDTSELLAEVQRVLDQAATLDFELQGDAVAEAVALYLSRPDREGLSDGDLARELEEMMGQAGLELFIGVSMVNAPTEPKSYFVAHGYYTIRLYQGPVGRPLRHQIITPGDVVFEARSVGDEIGVIFATVGASSVTPDYLLLRQEDGEWRVIWPLNPRESTPWWNMWITLDGTVKFASDDLSQLGTEGSSFAVFSEEDPFFECHVCPHRYFELLWRREGDLYLPQVTLPQDAHLYDRLWEVTRPDLYATLFEFLRRLRVGDEAGAMKLVVDAAVIEQAQALGLDDPARSFASEGITESGDNSFIFSENDEDFLPRYETFFQEPAAEGEHWLLTEIQEIE